MTNRWSFERPNFSLETRAELFPDMAFPKVFYCRDLNLWYPERDFRYGEGTTPRHSERYHPNDSRPNRTSDTCLCEINNTNPETEVDRNDPDYFIMSTKLNTLDFKHDKFAIHFQRSYVNIDTNNNSTTVVNKKPTAAIGCVPFWHHAHTADKESLLLVMRAFYVRIFLNIKSICSRFVKE